MIKTLFDMSGYGIYVWPAYALVVGILGVQLFLPWRRWKKINALSCHSRFSGHSRESGNLLDQELGDSRFRGNDRNNEKAP